MKTILIIIIPWLFLFNLGCEEPTEDHFKEGVILYMPPPDNCNGYVVKIENTLYYPENLGDKFKKDSLNVKLTYKELNGYHNCGFGGSIKIIKIIKILMQ